MFGHPFLMGQVPVIPQVPIVPQPLSSQQIVYQKQPEPLSEEKLQEKGLLIAVNLFDNFYNKVFFPVLYITDFFGTLQHGVYVYGVYVCLNHDMQEMLS